MRLILCFHLVLMTLLIFLVCIYFSENYERSKTFFFSVYFHKIP